MPYTPSPPLFTYQPFLTLTQVAFGEEQLDIFVFDFGVEPLTQKGGIGKELVSYRLLDRLDQLVLHERVLVAGL